MIGVDLKILQGNTLPLCSRSDFRAPSLLARESLVLPPATYHTSEEKEKNLHSGCYSEPRPTSVTLRCPAPHLVPRFV